MKILFVVLMLIVAATAAPWFDVLFGRSGYDYRVPRQGGQRGNHRWKEICRTINPDPYAFPGKVPYPAVPTCPW